MTGGWRSRPDPASCQGRGVGACSPSECVVAHLSLRVRTADSAQRRACRSGRPNGSCWPRCPQPLAISLTGTTSLFPYRAGNPPAMTWHCPTALPSVAGYHIPVGRATRPSRTAMQPSSKGA